MANAHELLSNWEYSLLPLSKESIMVPVANQPIKRSKIRFQFTVSNKCQSFRHDHKIETYANISCSLQAGPTCFCRVMIFTFYSNRGFDMGFQLMRNILVNWYFIKMAFPLVFFLKFEFITMYCL